MTHALIGAVMLAVGILVLVLLRARDGKERLLVRFPGAWIVVGLMLTFWIGGSVAIMASDLLR
jgi:formate hydrogenlyase subunit 3/multisubunit Na+/H+ antiporter MnhD subunit